MTKGKKKKEEVSGMKKIEPDPIVIPKEPEHFEEDMEEILSPRASKFLDRKKGEVDQDWIRMNDLLYSSLDYTETVPFKNEVIRLLYRYYAIFKSGRSFNADRLFDILFETKEDPDRIGFRVVLGEKLDEYLLAKKTSRK